MFMSPLRHHQSAAPLDPDSPADLHQSSYTSYQTTHQPVWPFQGYQPYGENSSSYRTHDAFVAGGITAAGPEHLIGETLDPNTAINTTVRQRMHSMSDRSEPDGSSPSITLSPGYDGNWTTNPVTGLYYNQFDKALTSAHISPATGNEGYRKTNSKFEIPEGRTLDTLDDLIVHAKDDDELKELKAQKRLLKNREAALQSRQRKKQHTETLEVEKKQYVHFMRHYEDKLAETIGENEKLAQDKLDLQRKARRIEKHAQELQIENNKLAAQVQHLQQSLMGFHYSTSAYQANPSSCTDLDNRPHSIPSVGDNDWSKFLDSPMLGVQHHNPKLESALTLSSVEHLRASKHHKSPLENDDSCLLLFLIAIGASSMANPYPEVLAGLLQSELAHAMREPAQAVMDFLSDDVLSTATTSKTSRAQVFGYSFAFLGPQSCALLKTLKDSLKPGVLEDVINLIQDAYPNLRNMSKRNMPASPRPTF